MVIIISKGSDEYVVLLYVFDKKKAFVCGFFIKALLQKAVKMFNT